MDWKSEIRNIASIAHSCSFEMAGLTTARKNEFLLLLSRILIEKSDTILRFNLKDVRKCERQNYSKAFIDRLLLTPERIKKMATSLQNIANLEDPVGKVIWETVRPNGLIIKRVRVPIGVIAIIYESRPDVTIEASSLCVKSGNCVLLRGGKEAVFSNSILVECIKEALEKTGINQNVVNLVKVGGRAGVKYLLSLNESIDLVIPRGGESLIRAVVLHSKIPVIKHYKGVCHIYVDSEADKTMALNVCLNAKVQRPATCNAMETLLIHRDIANSFLPEMAELFKQHNVEIRACDQTMKIIPWAKPATQQDWSEEYLDLIISIKVVNSVSEAISHINRYGTKHSDAIITTNENTARKFLEEVDSACVYHNASTRFTDGGEFGLGAEIGISTDKIHARGPMALEELTTYKYLIYGNGQIRT
ncbi:MAG TPA: glutamate-5-semialdehyde dehydrogenase [bacterium]|nr:glutamate-5-semialdehyde dehydrogenase [bacterium]HOL35358.1 glutamate-5-semialdehyde dehydrogenase [bacterium]